MKNVYAVAEAARDGIAGAGAARKWRLFVLQTFVITHHRHNDHTAAERQGAAAAAAAAATTAELAAGKERR